MHQQQQWNQSWNDGWSKGYDPYQSYGKGYASYDDSYGGSYSTSEEIRERCGCFVIFHSRRVSSFVSCLGFNMLQLWHCGDSCNSCSVQICCLKDSKLSEAYLIIAIAKEARNEVETVHAFRQLGTTNQDKSQNERPWEPLGTIDFGQCSYSEFTWIHVFFGWSWLISILTHIVSYQLINMIPWIWLRWLQYDFRQGRQGTTGSRVWCAQRD